MSTGMLAVDPEQPDPKLIEQAAAVLRRGGLVAFPTETVYGLGADARSTAAVARLYAAKGRPAHNPLIVHLPHAEGARRWAAAWPPEAAVLAERFWPGPLTLVVPRKQGLAPAVSAGLQSVALRVPVHRVAQALLAAADLPVAAPSANRSNAVSPTTAEHVRHSLGSAVDLLLDGGACPVGIESTVVSLIGSVPLLLRPGTIARPELEEVLGRSLSDPTPTKGVAAGNTPRSSPGMLERHYAPRAQMILFGPDERDAVAAELRDRSTRGEWVGAMALAPLGTGAWEHPMPPDPADYARVLYAALHAADAAALERLWVEIVPSGPGWDGIRDRLRRAGRAS